MQNERVDRHDGHLGDSLSTLRFDYTSVPLPVAKFLKGQADSIRQQCATSTIHIGGRLLEAKRHLSHGAFLRWIESEVCIPARSAQAYMQVAKWAADKGAIVALLPPSALYLLSASNTPDHFVSNVLSRAEAGEYIAPSAMREELRALQKCGEENRSDAEISTSRTVERDEELIAVTQESQSGARLLELVSIFLGGLSPTDFTRARDIVTSEAVTNDPQLTQNLGRAFVDVAPCCPELEPFPLDALHFP